MLSQKDKILNFLKVFPEGALKQEIMFWSLANYITCADRRLRELAEEGKVRSIKEEGSKTKRWFFIFPENTEPIKLDNTGQTYLL